MAKGNQKSQKTADITKVNANFDQIDSVFTQIQDQCKVIMPLVSDSLALTKKLVALYKEAFNKGFDSAE